MAQTECAKLGRMTQDMTDKLGALGVIEFELLGEKCVTYDVIREIQKEAGDTRNIVEGHTVAVWTLTRKLYTNRQQSGHGRTGNRPA